MAAQPIHGRSDLHGHADVQLLPKGCHVGFATSRGDHALRCELVKLGLVA